MVANSPPPAGAAPLGQDSALEQLRALWADGAGPRTLLLAGPDGVGRRSLAYWLAAYVNCAATTSPAPATLDEDPRPCGACASCQALSQGLHVDVREVGPATRSKSGRSKLRPEITIDQLVERAGGDPEPLSQWLRSRPQHRYRVAIIDDADALTESAANAFLKTLEEPPSWAVIVLIASGQDALLPTVASRAVPVRLGPAWLDGFDDLAGHPGHRLGQPGSLLRARASPEASDAARRAATDLLAALDGDLFDLLTVAEAFAKAVADAQVAAVRPGPLGWLMEPLRELGSEAYVAGAEAVYECEDAIASYAPAGLACCVLALRLRRSVRRAGG